MDLSLRRPGPDVVRALAMLGVVVMNYHGYLLLLGGDPGDGALADLFDPWTGPLSTRFAATFVLTAGVGVTLMTRSSIGDPARIREVHWRLVRRGLLLYAGGLLFDMIWRGSILPFYGAMFVLGAALFTVRCRWVVLTGVVAAIAAAAIRWWRYEAALDGHDTAWLTEPGPSSPRGLLFDVFVNGTHPLLPWLAFLCAGIVVGRFLGTAWWRPAAVAVGFVLYSAATIATSAGTSDRARILLSDDPFERGLAYTASALGTSLLAFAAISWLADRFAAHPVIEALQLAGQMSLSIYLAHALVFNVLVTQLDLIEPAGLGRALTFAIVLWLIATAAAIAYARRYGRGPAERLYRALTD
jgi:uncharacterized protein